MSKAGVSKAHVRQSDDHVVLETRRLLNALNAENAELKHQNNILSDRLRELDDSIRAGKEDKLQMEEDMKQINFSLMQQLKTKGGVHRDLESQLEAAQSQVRTLEGQLRKAGSQQDNLLGEIDILRERVQSLEAQSQSTKRQGADAAARQSKFDEERTLLMRQQQDLEQELQSITHHRDAALRLVDEERQRAQSIQFELDTYRETVTKECESLVATSKRTEAAESEALFAHTQMASLSSTIAQYLTDLQLSVRGLSTAAVETEGTLGQHLQQVERLQLALAQVVQEDDALIQYLRESWQSARSEVERANQEIKLAATNLVHAQSQVSQLEKQNQSLQADIRTLESALDELEQAVSDSGTLQRSLAEAQQTNRTLMDMKSSVDKEIEQFATKLAAQQQKAADLETKLQQSEAARGAAENQIQQLKQTLVQSQSRSEGEIQELQNECLRLQRQVDEQVDFLSGALGRLSSTSRQPSLMPRSHSRSGSSGVRPGELKASRNHIIPLRVAPSLRREQSQENVADSHPSPHVEHDHSYDDDESSSHNDVGTSSWQLDERLQQAMVQRAVRPSHV